MPRSHIRIEGEALASALSTLAERLSGLCLLRIYWYDGTSGGPTPEQVRLAQLHNFKVRLGFVNAAGKQKGVDSLIVTDMIALARNRAMADCVLLSGDEDLRIGVLMAQEYGTRVHLLGIRPARNSQTALLRQETDTTHEWTHADLSAILTQRQPMQSVQTKLSLEDIAASVADTVPVGEIDSLVPVITAKKTMPRKIDGRLLSSAHEVQGSLLDTGQRRKIRALFLQALQTRLRSL